MLTRARKQQRQRQLERQRWQAHLAVGSCVTGARHSNHNSSSLHSAIALDEIEAGRGRGDGDLLV